MALQVYAAGRVVRTLIDAFLPCRGLALAPRGLARDAGPRAYTEDEVISDMEQFAYVRIDARRAAPRGARDWVVVLVLAAEGKYALHGPDLRQLLNGVEAERAAGEGRLDEVIVVAEDEFFRKKNLTDVVRDAQRRFQRARAGGADAGGDAGGSQPFCTAAPYCRFVSALPASRVVEPHRVLAPAEVEALLSRERLAFGELPTIRDTDAPAVWIAAREGQVVEIIRASQTAGAAPYWRRVERGPLTDASA